MPKRYDATPFVDTSRLTFSERLEYQKLGIMAEELPTIYQNDQMKEVEYNSVLGLFLEKAGRRPKEELDREVEKRREEGPAYPPIEPETTLFGVSRRPVVDVNEDFQLTIAHSYTLKMVLAKYLSVRFGVPIYKNTLILQHPHHPYLMARPDFIALFPDPETGELDRRVLVKCKAASHWKLEEIKAQVPTEHELLCRCEMAVTGLDEAILAYLCDNNEGGVILYRLDRDYGVENRIIQCAKGFWTENVEAGALPLPAVPSDAAERDIALYAASRRQYRRPPELMERGMPELVSDYTRQKDLCDQYKVALEEAKEQLKRLEFDLSTHMIDRDEALCGDVKLRWTRRKTRSVDMDGLAMAYPDIYVRFVREKVTPGFEVRLKKSAQTKEAKEAA